MSKFQKGYHWDRRRQK